MKSILQIIIFCVISTVTAQDSFIIENVTLFDGEKIIPNTSVTIRDGQIEAVGNEASDIDIHIDGTGKFLIPALTNSHVHAFSPLSLKEAANAGVLNLLDMHGMEPMQKFMKSQQDSSGVARLFVAGYAATAPGGHGTQYGFEVPTLEKPEDAKQWVTDRVTAGVNHIKIIVEPWKNTISHETAKAVIDQAHQHQKVAVVHISKAEDAYQVFMNGADGLVHLWWDKSMDEAQLQAISVRKGIFVIPTVLTSTLMHEVFMGKSKDEVVALEKMLLNEIKRLHEAGIIILAGTDPPNANINMGTDLYKEMKSLSQAGLSPIEVLKSATSYPAEMFNLKEIGYIKPGYKADMILLSANPLESISNIDQILTIWKEGVAIERY